MVTPNRERNEGENERGCAIPGNVLSWQWAPSCCSWLRNGSAEGGSPQVIVEVAVGVPFPEGLNLTGDLTF